MHSERHVASMMAAEKTTQEAHPVKTFLETTSVKGVPRMMKSQRVTFRLLWGISVLLGTGIAAYFLTKLFMLYFSRKVTISVEEKLVTNTDFPSLTVCNLDPLANTNIDANFLQGFLDSYRQYVQEPTGEIDGYMVAESTDPSVLFVNLVDYEKPGLKPRNFVVTCRWDTESWETEEDCLSSMEMRVYQAKYGNCFTFEAPEDTSGINGFSAILYIDDSIEVAMPSFALRMERSFATGAVLTAHGRDSLPDIDTGIILSTGMSSEVGISVTRRVKLPYPFSDCEHTPSMPVSENYAYTQETCWHLCYQNKVIQECDCADSLVLSAVSQLGNDITYCVKVGGNIDVGAALNRSLCMRYWSSRTSLVCDDVCPDKCIDHRYQLTKAEITWPHPTSQIAFYDAYIHGKPYEDRFHFYNNLSARLARGEEIPRFYDMLRKETTMRDNFLEVSSELDIHLNKRFLHHLYYSKHCIILKLNYLWWIWYILNIFVRVYICIYHNEKLTKTIILLQCLCM